MEKKAPSPHGRWIHLSWLCKDPTEQAYIVECISKLGFKDYDEFITATHPVDQTYRCHVGLRKDTGYPRKFLDNKIPREAFNQGLVDFLLEKRKSWDAVQRELENITRAPTEVVPDIVVPDIVVPDIVVPDIVVPPSVAAIESSAGTDEGTDTSAGAGADTAADAGGGAAADNGNEPDSDAADPESEDGRDSPDSDSGASEYSVEMCAYGGSSPTGGSRAHADANTEAGGASAAGGRWACGVEVAAGGVDPSGDCGDATSESGDSTNSITGTDGGIDINTLNPLNIGDDGAGEAVKNDLSDDAVDMSGPVADLSQLVKDITGTLDSGWCKIEKYAATFLKVSSRRPGPLSSRPSNELKDPDSLDRGVMLLTLLHKVNTSESQLSEFKSQISAELKYMISDLEGGRGPSEGALVVKDRKIWGLPSSERSKVFRDKTSDNEPDPLLVSEAKQFYASGGGFHKFYRKKSLHRKSGVIRQKIRDIFHG